MGLGGAYGLCALRMNPSSLVPWEICAVARKGINTMFPSRGPCGDITPKCSVEVFSAEYRLYAGVRILWAQGYRCGFDFLKVLF